MAHIRQKFKGELSVQSCKASSDDNFDPEGNLDGYQVRQLQVHHAEILRQILSSIEEEIVSFIHLAQISSNHGFSLSKIVFTYILGYPVDIGHMEAVNLISSTKYSEKQIVRPGCPSRSHWLR